MIESRLIFIIGPPRSGTTLLMRMLNSHSQIYGRPESHLLGPLAHLGYYDTVEKAPFDQFQAADAARALVADLPRGEQDYIDACRAYVDVIYGRLLDSKGAGKRYLVDKTPANALVLPFIAKLFPLAKYVVLTRHPAAIFSSYANSFFEGDYEAARRFNPILNRYLPAIGQLLRDRRVPLCVVPYERLVREPESEMRNVCEFLELAFEPGMIVYGDHPMESKGLGDPNVDRQARPVTSSLNAWTAELAASPAKLATLRDMLARIDDRDLEAWGHPRASLWQPLESATSALPAAPPWDRFRVERKLLVWLRRDIQTSRFGGMVRKLRDLCDVLLRG